MKIKGLMVGAAVLATLINGGVANAVTYREAYKECKSGTTSDQWDKECCRANGGTPVERTYPDGVTNVTCEGLSDDQVPDTTPTNASTTDYSGYTWTQDGSRTPTAEQSEQTWTQDDSTEPVAEEPATYERSYEAPAEEDMEPAPRPSRGNFYE